MGDGKSVIVSPFYRQGSEVPKAASPTVTQGSRVLGHSISLVRAAPGRALCSKFQRRLPLRPSTFHGERFPLGISLNKQDRSSPSREPKPWLRCRLSSLACFPVNTLRGHIHTPRPIPGWWARGPGAQGRPQVSLCCLVLT